MGKNTFRVSFSSAGRIHLPRFLEAKYPEAHIDVVEIDPEGAVSPGHTGDPGEHPDPHLQPRRAVVRDELQRQRGL